MTMEDESKKLIPPYIAYKTLSHFLDRLKAVAVSSRIDRSMMSTYSGAVQGQLLTTLRYLNLTNEEGIPNQILYELVNSAGEERLRILKEIISSSYPFLFKKDLDLKQINPQQLLVLFEDAGVSGATIRKSVVFFLSMARDAGIQLSPHIKRMRFKYASPLQVRKTDVGKASEGEYAEEERRLKRSSLKEAELWLSIFPKFDPSWSDEIKAKWFDAFRDFRKEFIQ